MGKATCSRSPSVLRHWGILGRMHLLPQCQSCYPVMCVKQATLRYCQRSTTVQQRQAVQGQARATSQGSRTALIARREQPVLQVQAL